MAFKRSRQAFEADLQKLESPYVFYGSPLPPLDDNVRDDGSFVPVWKQEVTDDRGRKRLHGAFTGGFSAGYFNTVGSKEGWTPSAFVSSRQNRAHDAKKGSQQQRPEDFMDDEDLQDAEDARQLQTSDTFSGFGTADDGVRRHTSTDLFRPEGETIGTKLLRRMGWREGEGIGPKVRRSVPSSKTVPGDAMDTTPSDVPSIALPPKNDRKGLGFERGSEMGALQGVQPGSGSRNRGSAPVEGGADGSGTSLSKPSTKTRRSGIGIGVLNDDGSDDEDPFSMGPQIYNKVIGGEKKAKKKTSIASGNANPAVKAKPVFLSKKTAPLQGALRKCHDGRLPLDDFVLEDNLNGMASLSIKHDKYRPPSIPSDWKSAHTNDADDANTAETVSVTDAARSSKLNSKSRASVLGEVQLPGKSVFDFVSPAARDKLVAATGKVDLPPGLGERPQGEIQQGPDLQDLVPKLDPEVASQALARGSSGWMPYDDDEPKQDRYRTFLKIRAGLKPNTEGHELPPRAPGMSQDDWIVEMQEFARAAQVFKPVTGLMASRFTSSGSSLPQSDADGSLGTEELLTKPKAKPEDPAEVAAKMGMFGPMTRSVANFYPTRLLCKRFDVPMPEHSSMPQQKSLRATASSLFIAADPIASDSGAMELGNAVERKAVESTYSGAHAKLEPAVEAVDPDRNDALEQQKPNQELFKAIFGDEDEDEEL